MRFGVFEEQQLESHPSESPISLANRFADHEPALTGDIECDHRRKVDVDIVPAHVNPGSRPRKPDERRHLVAG